MVSKSLRLLAAASLVSGALLSPLAATARSVSVDFRPFDQTGEDWHGDFTDLSNDGHFEGSLPFLLNFGDGAKAYDFSFNQNGFVQFVAVGGSGGGIAPSGNYIAPFAADLAQGEFFILGTNWANGLIDPVAPYDLSEATQKAFRFTWFGMCPASDVTCANPDTFQLVILDQGAGDFRLQFNYGFALNSQEIFGDPTSTVGQQGYSLGDNVLALHTGPFNSRNPDYCFTAGVGGLCGVAAAVPEPETYVLLALGLVSVGRFAQRRARQGLS
jgi:hypothetical protein